MEKSAESKTNAKGKVQPAMMKNSAGSVKSQKEGTQDLWSSYKLIWVVVGVLALALIVCAALLFWISISARTEETSTSEPATEPSGSASKL